MRFKRRPTGSLSPTSTARSKDGACVAGKECGDVTRLDSLAGRRALILRTHFRKEMRPAKRGVQ